ncbi:MAG: AMIN domain-containing protein, partial [Kofleriaceae bacterium]|nr:AMIN domain-containing protein [Kofleriaceae bacterium]
MTLVVATFALAQTASAGGQNEIRTVTTEQDGSATRVIVRSTQTPTFTVYKLERPTRVVVDVPNARLASALVGHDSTAAFMPNTWAVSAVTAQQQDDGGAQVRVVITLARPGSYDVQTEGNAFVVRVTARDAAPAGEGSDDARRAVAAAEQARAEAERSKAELAKIRDQVEATRLAATKDREAAARAKADAEAARMAIATERNEVARAKADAEAARLAAAKDREAAATSAAERKAARKELDAIARAKTDADAARATAARELEIATRAKADAEAAQKAATAA